MSPTLDEEQFYNVETDTSSTTDGPQQAVESQRRAGASPQDIETIQPLNKDQIEKLNANHAGHRDGKALLHSMVPDLSGEQRPQSMAVPWMNTANSLQQKPPSPVMSMSPQAAYMSKIIPNAVLPPSIDVVEISRGQSRNSVRTVSKGSLLLSSPVPSRPSSRASSSRASTINSGSHYNPPNLSDSSCWSNSESSDTLVSDSSTISSSSTPRQKRSQNRDDIAEVDKNTVHPSISKASKSTSNGKVIIKGDEIKREGPFARSLSVMKPKKAPPPPNRSYSLHNKIKRRSRDQAEVAAISGESTFCSISVEANKKNTNGSPPLHSRIIDSPGYNADTSSLEDSTGSVSFSTMKSQQQPLKTEEGASLEKQETSQEKKLSTTVLPSSGYSSQDGTSAQFSKQTHSSSPRHKRGILAKLQRLFPGSTTVSTPLPLTQLKVSEKPESTEIKPDNPVNTASVSPSVRALIELFNIPPPPKVHAPPPPPPEVWAHSKRTIELLLGPPAPDNIYSIIKKNPKDRRQQRKCPLISTDSSVKNLVVERKCKNPIGTVDSVNGSLHVQETKKVQESAILNAELENENSNRLGVDLKGNRNVTEVNRKVRVSDILNGMLVKAVEKSEERRAVFGTEEGQKGSTQGTEMKSDRLPAISLAHISPSPTPPVYSPAQPSTKQNTEQFVMSSEMSWPPPPPPIGLNGQEDFDFLPPPPPVFSEEDFVIHAQVPPKRLNPEASSSTSISSVVKIEYIRETVEAEPQMTNSSQEKVPPLLNIPAPPPYTAPPPPVKSVSPLVIKNVSLLPTIKEVSQSPPKDVSHPPPKEVSPPQPPKEVSPPPSHEVFLPPPFQEGFLPSPPKEVSHPPPKTVFPLLLTQISHSPKIVDPPQPPKEVSPPPPEELCCLLPPEEVSPLPPSEEVSPLPQDVFLPPPPQDISSPPSKEASAVRPNELCPPLIEDVPPLLVKDACSILFTAVSPSLVIEDPPLPPEQVSSLPTEEVCLLSLQENVQPSKDITPENKLAPTQSVPSPTLVQEIDHPQENVGPISETNPVSSNSILKPPQSIPPPPPLEHVYQPQVAGPITDGLATQEASHSSPSQVPVQPSLENCLSTQKTLVPSPHVYNICYPQPLSEQAHTVIKYESSPASTENQTPELNSAHVLQEESTAIVTPSLLELQSGYNSPEPPKAQDQLETEVIMRNHQCSNQGPTLSASGDVPPKPIRRSMIISFPTSTSPSTLVPSQLDLPKSQSHVVPPVSSATGLSPTKKSPPATTVSPSMNLQEAIRLRTAARSLGAPASRLNLHSPASPTDLCKSPSSTASFIFSKSTKKVVIETKPVVETKAVNEAKSGQMAVKVPPPVAKKPKTKGGENETSEGTEQIGQEELQKNIMGKKEYPL